MLCTRIVGVIHVKNNVVVKGIQLEGLRALGKPDAFANYYYTQGIDEIVLLDVVASLYQRTFQPDIIRMVAGASFVPLAVGGGIRSVTDAVSILRAGADKVIVNTSGVARPSLLSEIASVLGSQSLTVLIEARRHNRLGWEAMTNNGRECSGRSVVDWAREAEEMGAGEILLVSVDNDGSMSGYDLALIQDVSDALTVPLVVCGGCGVGRHAVAAMQAGADAVGISSALHYRAIRHIVSDTENTQEGNVEFLKGQRGDIPYGISVGDAKVALQQAGYNVR